MAAFDGIINLSSSEHRPCEVNGKKAVFHRWDFIQKPIGAEAHIGGAPAGQLSYTLGSATRRKKQRKKRTSILKNYVRVYIPIVARTAMRLRKYTHIQRISGEGKE